MKRLFYLISGVALLHLVLGGMLLAASCSSDSGSGGDEPDQPEQPKNVTLELSRTDLVFEAAGGEKTFTVSSNGTWSIENASGWCKVSAVSGSGDQTITVTADAYSGLEDRNTNLTVKAGDKTQVLGVTQKYKDAILLSRDKFDVPQAGETISVEVQSNIAYEVTIPSEFQSWISSAPNARAVTVRAYEFVISENEDAEIRAGYIVFSGNSVQDTVRVYQAQKDRLVLTDPVSYVSEKGGELTVELKTNIDYDVRMLSSVSWLSLVETRALRTDRLHFSVSENASREMREASVVVKDRNSELSDTLRVCQYGKGLIVSQQKYLVPRAGKTISVEVKGGIEYNVTIPSAFQSWIASVGGTSSSSSAVTPKTYRFVVSELEGDEGREGYIVFSGNSLTDTAYITQLGAVFAETVLGVKLEMVYVEGGTFQMGATSEQGSDAYSDETPVHEVTLSDYYIGKFEVTQGLWKAVMGSNPSYFKKGDNYPVEYVSWNDIQTFLSKLNQLTGKKYALPTEAQWEYAARGGVKSRGYKYSGSNTIGDVAWHWGNGEYSTSPVGTKQPNELGLYDMSGNVYEWCSDWYGDYTNELQTNPTGPSMGSDRVNRGGGWRGNARNYRVSYRSHDSPGGRYSEVGFRLVLLP